MNSAAQPEHPVGSAAFFARPTATLDRLRREHPVHYAPEVDAWLLSRYADVAWALRDRRLSVERAGNIARCPHTAGAHVELGMRECQAFFSRFMVFRDPPAHGPLRAAAAASFTPAAMRLLEPGVTAAAEALVSRALEQEAFDLVWELAEPLPMRAVSLLFGVPKAQLERLSGATNAMFRYFGATRADEHVVEDARAAIAEMRACVAELLDAGGDRSPLIESLAVDAAAHGLDREDVVALVATLLAGSSETSSRLIAHAVLALLRHPEEYEALVRDPSRAARVVEETLRFDGPALSVVRSPLGDVSLGGQTIPSGARVYCMLHAANHDPEVFAEPARFWPDRPHNPHLGLGHGRHFCLGAAMTRMTSRVALTALARRAPALSLAGEPDRVGSFAMRGLRAMHVRQHPPSRGRQADASFSRSTPSTRSHRP